MTSDGEMPDRPDWENSCYPCMRGHFFIPVVNTSVLKESFYRGCQVHIM